MSWTRSLTPISGHSSAGPSSMNPVIVATPASVMDIGAEIVSTIEGIPTKRRTPATEALAATLQNHLAVFQTSLQDNQELYELVQTDLGLITTTLQAIRLGLQPKAPLRKRDKAKISIDKLLRVDAGIKEPDPCVSWQLQVEDMFQVLELKLATPRPPTTAPVIAIPLDGSDPASMHPVEESGDGIPQTSKSTGRRHTVLDSVEKVLQAAVAIAEVIPPPGGGIVKAISGVTLSIITTIKGIESNNDDAVALARHLTELFCTIIQFLRDGKESISNATENQLKAFRAELELMEKELKSLSTQGKAKKAISHARNKETLASCDARIRRSFTQLQIYLSLDTVRQLTRLGDTEARREADRLLCLLGDLDTGARDKADDPADLVCLPGTRVELLEDVRQWIDGSSSERVLWISGVAGCGKSAVAATVASQQSGLSGSAIFHFSRGNQGRNNRVICCLARQLARWNHGSLEHIVLAAVQKYPDIATMHFAAQFQHLIVEPLKMLVPGAPPVLIVVDALDEWEKQESAAKLVDLIRRSNSDLHPSVKFVLTSRNEAHLSRAFKAPLLKSLVKCRALDDTPGDIVNRDIKLYLEKWFKHIRSSSEELEGSEWPGANSVNELVKLSGGLFQWASTAIRYIEAGHPPIRLDDIRANPNQLGDLDLLYQHILSSLFRHSSRPPTLALLQDVLGFIVVAPTPITLNTIAYLLTEDAASTPAKMTEVRVEVLAVLGAFLIIPADPNEPIRVLHPSIIDFLTDLGRCPDLRFYIERIPHNQTTAMLCFRRMGRDLKRDICEINDPTKFNSDIQDAISRHVSGPLRYVCCYWASHLLASDAVPPRELAELVDHFCIKLVLFWLEVMSLTGAIHQAFGSIRAAEEWASTIPSGAIANDSRQLLYEVRRFLLAYSEPISTNVHHIYLSALSSAPSRTLFLRTYRELTTAGFQILLGPVDKYWPASLWVAERHSEAVTCVAVSLDGKTVVSGSDDMTVRLWDVETGTQRGEALEGHSDLVNSVAFVSDGKTVVSGSNDKTVRLWDVETGKQRGNALEGHSNWVRSVAVSLDGKTVASGSFDETIRLWDVETGTQRGDALEGHSDSVNSVAFASDGKMIVSGSDDMTIRLWDVDTGTQKGDALEGHADWVRAVAFTSDGKTVVSGSDDNTVRLWDVDTGMQRGNALEGHSGSVNSVAFASDGKIIMSGSDDTTIRLWDVETGTQRGDPLEGHSDWVRGVAFAPNGRTVVSGSNDETVRLWDIKMETRGEAPEGHSDCVNSVAFASDDKTIVSGSSDKTVRLWDLETGVQRGGALKGHSDWVRAVAFASDGQTVVSGSDDSTVRLWDVETGMQRGDALEGHSKDVACVAFSLDGKIVVSGSFDETIRLWDVETGTQRGDALEGHSNSVGAVAFSPNGRTVVSGSHDETVRLWDVDLGTQKGDALPVGFSVTFLAFSSDGQQLNVAGADQFDSPRHQLWDLTSGIPIRAPSNDDDVTSNSPGVSLIRATPVEPQISPDGWVCYGHRRWLWLPAAFGRNLMVRMVGNRLVSHHDRHVCIIDVSDVLYLIR